MTATDVLMLMQAASYLSPLVLLAGCVIGGITYKKNPAVSRWIFLYLLVSLALDILSRYWGKISSDKNNLFLLSVNGLIDLIFFSRLYLKFMGFSYPKLVKVVTIIIGSFAAVSVVLRGTKGGAPDFQVYDKMMCDGAIFVFALASMFDLLRGKEELRREIVRINATVLLYSALNMLMSLIMNFLINTGFKTIAGYFWVLRLGLVITLYLILIHIIWQTGKNRKHWLYG
jgi:hypothetical protein